MMRARRAHSDRMRFACRSSGGTVQDSAYVGPQPVPESNAFGAADLYGRGNTLEKELTAIRA